MLIDAVLDPQLDDISHALVLTLLYILDNPGTHRYLRPSLGIKRLLALRIDDPRRTRSQPTSARRATGGG